METLMEAPKCRTCGKRHWSRVCETFDVALETEIVTQVTKNVSQMTKNVTPETAIVTMIEGEGFTVADLKGALSEAEAEVRQLKARVVLLEAELEVRKPKAVEASERMRRYRERKRMNGG
jgi:hypothetical protein